MFSNLFKMDRFHTCSKHNYTGTQPCPSCIWEEKEYIRALNECEVVPRLNNDEEKKCDICGNDLPKKSYYFRCESCREKVRYEKATKIKYSEYKIPMFYDEQSDSYYDDYEDMVEYYEGYLSEGEKPVLPKYVFGCKETKFKIDIQNSLESAIEDMYDDFDDIVDLEELYNFVNAWNQKQTAKSYYQDNNTIIFFD